MNKKEILSLLEKTDKYDDKGFVKIISGIIDADFLSEKELAHLVDTSRSAVRRWKSGENTPHPFMRPVLFKEIRKQLTK